MHYELSTMNYFYYLCSRFPRNRWQEETRGLLCCAWNDTAKLKNYKIKELKNGFN